MASRHLRRALSIGEVSRESLLNSAHPRAQLALAAPRRAGEELERAPPAFHTCPGEACQSLLPTSTAGTRREAEGKRRHLVKQVTAAWAEGPAEPLHRPSESREMTPVTAAPVKRDFVPAPEVWKGWFVFPR